MLSGNLGVKKVNLTIYPNYLFLCTLQTLTFYKFLASRVFLIMIFQYIIQNYILAGLARTLMVCVVPEKFVCVFLFFVLLWTFVEFDTNK